MKYNMLLLIIAGLIAVAASTCEIQPSVYFATNARGLSALSLETNQVDKIVASPEIIWGVTYDSIHNKLYWCTGHQIFKSKKDGSEVETVLDTTEYGTMCGLATDWYGGYLYVISDEGYILACSVAATQVFRCLTILDGQSGARGIALDPREGLMYWTRYSAGSIYRAGMDGSSLLTLVTGLDWPHGLAIDLASQRLYWTEYAGQRIQSSDLDGGGIQLVVQLPSDSYPWSITVLNDRIYWGNAGDNKLQTATKDGQELETLYTEAGHIHQITFVPAGTNQQTA